MLLPLLSIGLFTWVSMTVLAVWRRSLWLGLTAAGYVVLFGALFALVEAPEGSTLESIWITLWVLTCVGGTVHAALLVTIPAFGGPRRKDASQVWQHERRIRREQARTLVEHYPAVARELAIGRPDRPRLFDDGGLLDLNTVPEQALAALPGVSPDQARKIVAARTLYGGFGSVDDLITRGLLPAPLPPAVRDTLVVVEGPPSA